MSLSKLQGLVMDREACNPREARGCKELDTAEQLNNDTYKEWNLGQLATRVLF